MSDLENLFSKNAAPVEVTPDANRPSSPRLVRYCYVLFIKRKISLLDFHILVLMADNNWNRKNLQSMNE